MTPFKAYKGFDKNLKCRDQQFVIGETVTKPEKDAPRLCSGEGFHYCKELKFEVILAAKVKYSGIDEKHRNDIREMCGVKEPKAKERSINIGDIPF